MRPEQLVIENVGSFRGRHTVDLADVELFVLAGPTGAGKSTVIDAITLALYGSVARYDNANLIEPAINKLATQSTVSLTFTMAGERYVATRQIARTSTGGAQAKEVRLERVRADGSTTAVASGSREVDEAVVRLLGLTFDEFCKTVVLPQGAFAQFLHGGRKERQDLLVRLLGLEEYELVGQAARARAKALEAQLDAGAKRLEAIGDVDQEAVDAATARAERMEEARTVLVDELIPQLEGVRERWHEARVALDARKEVVGALAGLRRPDDVDDLAGRVRAADEQVARAEKDVAEARAARDAAERAAADAPATAPLQDLLRVDGELATTLAQLDDRRGAHAQATRRAEAARTDADAKAALAAEAAAALEELRRRHVAHDLATGLERGADCPVCLRPVDELPDRPDPTGLGDAQQRADAAKQAAEQASAAAQQVEQAVARSAAQLEAVQERVEELRSGLAAGAETAALPLVDGRADGETARKRLDAAAATRARLDQVRKDAAAAERTLEQARKARQALDGAAERAWRAFDEARDTVSAHGAPAPSQRDDVAAAWDELLGWAGERSDAAGRELQDAADQLDAAAEEGTKRNEEIRRTVAATGVEVADDAKPEQALAALSQAAAEARSHVGRLREQLDEAARLREERRKHEEDRQVAELLGSLLRRDQFEQWLLNRLSTRLVAGASRILSELTQGAFSLVLDVDKGAFEVIDHLNADERRPAKTLSGGETFLASLALALALAEHVAAVNQAGAARLDALFLDEGFGTLDPETLETVAAAIEELSGSRMVGVITHVRELAERIPSRFDVRRGPDGSSITPAQPDAEAALTAVDP